MSPQARRTYERLMAGNGYRDPFDRHVFACVLAAGLTQAERPVNEFLGLTPAILRLLLAAYFPNTGISLPAFARACVDAVEEEDFRALLLSYRGRHVPEEEWLAAIIARRSLGPNHLWEDLGLVSRDDLNALIRRHFPRLFTLNDKNMRWKKFFYRTMCEAEGMRLCKSPNCDECPDLCACFEDDSGILKKMVVV